MAEVTRSSRASRASWPGHGGGGPGSARGAVTAEFAVALPAVLLLLALLLAGAAGGVTQLRLEEAARAGARALARGEDPAAVEGIVRTLAGPSATASVAADGEWLSVTVADRVGGPLGATVPWTLTARATTRNETPAASWAPKLKQGSFLALSAQPEHSRTARSTFTQTVAGAGT
ncbi:TadE family type IV pilus minor pilin [Pseudarthrobacter sp. DSP2-3-2b1]|uniref:TadE family type IV pilus minor pilin n=1 Tax=Pseudarthrobacter sp. DSP2-3-2b1 TaxID=2804661 RepID=UPI003CFAB28C